MSKAMVNYLVDAIIAAAFIVATFTGILFLLPSSLIGILGSGEPGMLGVSMATWNTLHEWSALAMIAGVIVHLVLHWRWVVNMTRCALRGAARRNRTLTNYVLDIVIAVAFVVATFTGILFLLPSSLIGILGSGEPGMLGVSMATWNTLHEWSSLAMIGGAIVHVVLHWGWVVKMTKRAFGSRRPAPVRSTSPEAARAAGVHVVAPACGSSERVMAARATTEAGASGASGRERGERRISRKAFLAGTAAACAGAALVLVLGRGDGDSGTVYAATQADPETDHESNGNGNSWGDEDDAYESDESTVPEQSADPSASGDAGSSSGTTETQPAPATSTERVSVDAGACNGCGDCVGTCPYGVFSFAGGVATAANPGACTLCGRCVRACPTGAITLRA